MTDHWELRNESTGEQRSCAAWGMAGARLTKANQTPDTLTFTLAGAYDGDLPFAPNHHMSLYRAGARVFFGRVTAVTRAGEAEREGVNVTVSGPWWWLEHITFLQTRKAVANKPLPVWQVDTDGDGVPDTEYQGEQDGGVDWQPGGAGGSGGGAWTLVIANADGSRSITFVPANYLGQTTFTVATAQLPLAQSPGVVLHAGAAHGSSSYFQAIKRPGQEVYEVTHTYVIDRDYWLEQTPTEEPS